MTRLVSRYVMLRNYQSPHVEGPAATYDPLPDRFASQTAGQIGIFAARDHWDGP
ncbi:hypothetical protein [Bradyrhizobium sp. 33ap4]|uniref:hypothetical protein n=1 Tax=Bradyrhizobium sp. 33ap4 TaxID=3061630 RepID=UPI00292DB4DC|nr:hypothetical protein [Bradyrhizobium sp. 33ap4]